MPNTIQTPWAIFKQWWKDHPFYAESLRGIIHLIFAILNLYGFTFACMALFDGANPFVIANKLYEENLAFQFIPPRLAILFFIPFTPLASSQYYRYFIPPLTILVSLLIGGSFFVQNIYGLDKLGTAFQHVFSSMFGLFYPRIKVDSNSIKKKSPEDENPLEKIGGPGFVLIQPGNAVIFNKIRKPPKVGLSNPYFMTPYESIGTIISLEDQHGYHAEVRTQTSDGIQVILRDIHYRYRIHPEEKEGKIQERSILNPYPFAKQAMIDMTINLPAGDSWSSAVARNVVGEIAGFVSSHSIDQLTAPRQDNQDPRGDIKKNLFEEGVRRRLRNQGAELLWIDIGHFDIIDEDVDLSRLNYWTAKWIGDVQKAKAYGEAKKLAYHELGRAEAQADMIMSVMDAVEGVDFSKNPVENLRHVLLVRTAQILDAMSENKQDTAE